MISSCRELVALHL